MRNERSKSIYVSQIVRREDTGRTGGCVTRRRRTSVERCERKCQGWQGTVVDFLVTRIAHFGLAYTRLFARKPATKRSPPLPPLAARVRGRRTACDANERMARGEDGAATGERVYEVTRRNKYNIMQTGGADRTRARARVRQSLGNLGNPE